MLSHLNPMRSGRKYRNSLTTHGAQTVDGGSRQAILTIKLLAGAAVPLALVWIVDRAV